MSGLFRGMSVEIEGTAKQVGGIQTVMDQLCPQPIVTLTDGWYDAAKAATAYKIQVQEIARMGPITPRGGMTVSPGTKRRHAASRASQYPGARRRSSRRTSGAAARCNDSDPASRQHLLRRRQS